MSFTSPNCQNICPEILSYGLKVTAPSFPLQLALRALREFFSSALDNKTLIVKPSSNLRRKKTPEKPII